ncbi:phosphatidylglycerophosphate phosphatase 1, chloroplastic/mitochondrial [Primulina huaijiensis]|uniref:phosphatidylglycerophosphate phosphatase 1, chloroplastic/mitochondrial n=1 Tax=Primulina huaijiensis TaxID=1492673 RepID=UPI003CC78FC4
MHSISIGSWQACYYYPLPKNPPFHSKVTLDSKPRKIQCKNCSFLTLTATNSCSKEQEKKRNHFNSENTNCSNLEKHKPFQDFYSSFEIQEPQFEEGEEEIGSVIDWDIPSIMWWVDFKAALGQRINLEGITCSVGILSKYRHLVMPHVSVPDIRYINWAELKNSGFKGVVFDKDNTITVPYSLSLWAPLASSIEQCKLVFGDNIAVFSNSAGLCEYDPDGRKASALEDAIGIKVIRHGGKKPGGNAEEIENNFGCESSRLIMVGDRPFTDIVFGNRHGLFTILTEPLSHTEEPLIVRQVRLLEVAIVKRWSEKGLKPITHGLLTDPMKCVNNEPL